MKTRRIAKTILFIAALVPAALLLRGLLHADTGALGANPAETIQLQTGRWTFKFLLLTLTVTPVRRLTGWNAIIQYRRMLGLFAFFYASLHFMAYYAFDLQFTFTTMLDDIARRPFIMMGFAAFLTMAPLALTSTRGWIRRLGKKWTVLHRLIYVSAICAAIHFIWKVKVVSGDPIWYASAVAALLLFRAIWQMRSRGALRPASRPVQPP